MTTVAHRKRLCWNHSADLGQAQLGSKETAAPLSFLDFDEDCNPREIRTTMKATSLLGKTDTIRQSAVNKTKVAYQATNVKDRTVYTSLTLIESREKHLQFC